MKAVLILVFSLYLSSSYAQEESAIPYFDGFYLGIDFGTQNVFGGSFVNEIDILAQESKFVTEIAVGYRKQFLNNRFTAGAEFSLGFLDGSLRHEDASQDLVINYETSSQTSYGIKLGTVLGKNRRIHLFSYANETKRKFDVRISEAQYNYGQTDKQGMLKYGLGIEYQIWNNINIAAAFGALRVDFGELETNIDVEDKYDFTLGMNYQF